MRILLMQLVLPIICYFIGVAVGKRTEAIKYVTAIVEHTNSKLSEDIQHVGYTTEQMGYDK